MKFRVLLIEHDVSSMRVLKRVIGKVNYDVIACSSLTEAKHVFAESTPENFLCAVVNFSLPDAKYGEAIDFAVNAYIPVIVLTDNEDSDVRNAILKKEIVDYIPRQNTQIFEYLSRLLERLEKNQEVGVLVADASRKNRNSIAPLLKRHNFTVYETNSAEKVKDILHTHGDIKLVIVDEYLPECAGTEVVDQIRRSFNKNEISVIGVSGRKKPALLARFLKSGANDYITRPFCHEEFFCRIMQNIEYIEQIDTIRQTANSDYLTGLPNRRFFFQQVEVLMKREHQGGSLALVDLDHFKRINDEYGHDIGDFVLKDTAKLLNKHFKGEIVSRFGGEEFCIYFANTPIESAEEKLNEFRQSFFHKSFSRKKIKLHCSLSIGLTFSEQPNIDKMLKCADEHLYKAKSNGRNQLVCEKKLAKISN